MNSRKQNGEGSLFYAKSKKRWIIQYTDPVTKKAKQLTQKKNETDKEFKKKYYKLITEINEDTYLSKSKIALIDIIHTQTDELYRANKIKETSYLRRIYVNKLIEKMGIANVPIQQVTNQKVNESLLYLKDYSESTISKVCSTISSAYDYAIAYNIINVNPFKIKNAIMKPRSTKATKRVEALTIEEQKAFEHELNKKDDKYKDIFLILLYTGARVGEVLALKGEDIDLKNRVIRIKRTLTKDKHDNVIIGNTTKTYAGTRDIPIINKLLPIISKYSTIHGIIFLDNKNLITASTINTHFKKICKNANIKVVINHNKSKIYKGEKLKVNLKTSTVNTHMLRHTFATRCIEAGMSAVALSKILGHTDIQTTLNTYTSVFDRYQKSELDKVINYLDKINQSSVN